ncbi:MAG: sodium-dependent transporter, partial [Rikenellaceae bacterium]|nr:sodium-dependent transporter [Rikenellaceae bacterium]
MMKERGLFGSKFGIIAAAAGSAIGLGNIWRFPYVAGENGGAAFLLIYLIIVILIGLPMMLAELSIGRASKRNVFGAFKVLKPHSGWPLVGLLGVLTPLVILIFYSVVSGWTMSFLWQSLANQFKGLSSEQVKTGFDAFVATGWQPILWSAVFVAVTGIIVIAGVEKGIERYSKILMPVMLLLLIAMGLYSMTLSGFGAGMKFLFQPDFSKITGTVFLEALGQAFFSLSLGMGIMITYGSYIRDKDNMGTTVGAVALSDTLIALLAGIAIFPAVFTFGINPTSGPELVFITLPGLFQQMTGGHFLSIVFFALLLIAAVTSAVSVMEVLAAYYTEEFKVSRRHAGIVISLFIMFMASICAISQMPGSRLRVAGMDLFDLFDKVSATYMLPVGAFFVTLFAGWVFGKKRFEGQVTSGGLYNTRIFPLVLFIVRYIAPLVILDILQTKAGHL